MSFSSEDIIDGPYTLNGSTVDFSFTFEIWATSDLLVTITQTDGTEVPLTLTTHYSVAATNNDFSSGGTVTITNAVRDAYTTGTITITLDFDFIQESEYTSGVTLDRALLEQDLDRAARRDLILKNRQDRNLQVPFTDDQAGSMEIPNKATRSSNLLGFDAEGRPIAADGTATPVSTWAATLVDDTSASAALTTLGVSAFVQTILNDADASAVFTTLGITAFIETLLDDATAAAAKATLNIPEQGYMNLSMTNIGATTEPTFTGDVEVNGTLVSLSAESGTGFSGLATSSDVWVYVTSAGAVTYSATAPAWSSSLGGWYNSTDRAVAWMRKDSADGYRYKHFLPTEQVDEVRFSEVREIGDWNMDTTVSVTIAHELEDQEVIRDLETIIRQDNNAGIYRLGVDGSMDVPSTNINLVRVTAGTLFDSANFDDTTYNRGWVYFTHVVL